MRIARFLGVYDANGGIVGELRYVIGHLVGTAECALCDITHSPVRRKRTWDAMVARLDAPFDLRHRNELSDIEQRALAGVVLPVVAAELADGTWTTLLDVEALRACDGDVDVFAARLAAAVGSA